MTTEKIRVLIVDDIAETRENIRKLLQFEAGVEVVGTARTGKEGIELAVEQQAHVVLMDINMPDMDGITATEQIMRRLPATKIVILSVQSDPDYMRRAMMAGACDFLSKPPSIDELTSAIRRAGKMAIEARSRAVPGVGTPGAGVTKAGQSLPGMDGRIIVVYSPKGGSGSTSLAVNLAIALHNEDTPVVVVDGNLQYGDVSFFFNEHGKNNVLHLAPRVDELDSSVLEEVLIIHAASGVSILAAPQRPEDAENVRSEQFARLLRFLTQMFSYVVVDTATYLNDVTLATFDESDIIVLVTTQEIPNIKNIRLFLDLTSALGIEPIRFLLVMNQYDKRVAITPERVAENLKLPISAVIPLEEKTVVPAMNRGVPFMVQSRASPVSRGVLNLAEAVRQRVTELEGTPAN
jgi:pilus assembly protein CpaE